MSDEDLIHHCSDCRQEVHASAGKLTINGTAESVISLPRRCPSCKVTPARWISSLPRPVIPLDPDQEHSR